MERKLTTILAADVVGYSSLMERDEAGTFSRLREYRKQLFEPEIEEHHGRIFKLMGDGLLAEFGSVVEAVECAVALQSGLAERNADVPADKRVQVRIGINLGEVIVEGDDRLGEGVNIAARLQQLAEPGGICVSGKVAKEVDKKLDFSFVAMGNQKVKNIDEPIPVFLVKTDPPTRTPWLSAGRARNSSLIRNSGLAAALIAVTLGAAWRWHQDHSTPKLSGSPTVAVLPLANMSSDPDLQYFADGMTETMIESLAKSPEIRVVARTSSDAFKGKQADIREIGKELNAQFLLEGSVQKGPDRVRIVAQLIDAKAGNHVWTERYDRESSNPLALQDEIAKSVVLSIAGDEGLIKRAQEQDAWAKETSSLEEYDYYLRGHELLYRLTPSATEQAIKIYEQGLDKYPSSALLKVKLGWGYYQRVYGGWSTDIKSDYSRAAEFVQAGLREKNVTPLAKKMGHYFLAFYNLELKGDYDEALREVDITLKLAPADPSVICNMGIVSIGSGRPDFAISLAERILDLRSDFVWNSPHFVLGRAFFVKGDYRRAAEYLKDAPQDAATSLPFLAASYAKLGDMDVAKQLMGKARTGLPHLSVSLMHQLYPNRDPEVLVRQDDALRLAGLPES